MMIVNRIMESADITDKDECDNVLDVVSGYMPQSQDVVVLTIFHTTIYLR